MIRALAVIMALAAATAAHAAEVRVLSAGAVQPGLMVVAAAFEARTGDPVSITYATGPQLLARVSAGETADVLIAPQAVTEALIAAGRVPGPFALLGKVGVGVAVRDGAPVPDVSSVAAVKAAVLAAKTVVYNRASTGVHVEKVLKEQGLADAVAGKSERPADGEAVMRRLAAGSGNEIGFGAVTEIELARSRGEKVALVGPLPAAIQNETPYGATAFPNASPQGRAFLAALTGPEGRKSMADKGVR